MYILENLSKIQLSFMKNHIKNAISVKAGLLHNIPSVAIKMPNLDYIVVDWQGNYKGYQAHVYKRNHNYDHPRANGKLHTSIMGAVSDYAPIIK